MLTRTLLFAVAVVTLSGSVEGQGPAFPRLALTPDLTIDGYRHELVAIDDVLTRADGVVVVEQSSVREILVFDADGERLATLGERATGPASIAR